MLTIGSELISSASVALSELVKNSYDADASNVLVQLSEPDNGPPELLVLDDGVGMSVKTITGVWLEPATPFRRRLVHSGGGRRVLGEKGVGRFAAAKLAAQLELVSRAKGDRRETAVSVDWSAFEDDTKYLDEIRIPVVNRRPDSFASQGGVRRFWQDAFADLDLKRSHPTTTNGTLLRMAGLRDVWDEALAQEVQRSLQRLVSPFDAKIDAHRPTFEIYLRFPPRLSSFSGPVGPAEELSKPHYVLDATIDAGGAADVELVIRGESEKIEKRVRLTGASGGQPTMGPFGLHLRVFDRDAASLDELAPGLAARLIRSQIDAAAGVSIYRNGFRVLPYGESRDDWLRLDLRRVNNPTLRLSNNQIIGFVSINREANPALVDQSNREGLVDGPALSDLRVGVLQLISVLESYRQNKRAAIRRSRRKGGVFERRSLEALRKVAERSKNASLQALVRQAATEIEEADDEIREALARYQRLATLGALVDRFIHEAAQPLTSIRNAARAAQEAIAPPPSADEDCRDALISIGSELKVVRQQAGVLNQLLNRFRPFGGRRRGRPHEITVEGAVADAVALLKPDADRVKAVVTSSDGRTRVTVDHTELQELVLNLVGNSLYWVGQQPEGESREVQIDVRRNADHSVTLRVSDSGPGVPAEFRDRIFEPYFSGRDGGYGLGLNIATEIVSDYYGGELELVDDGPLPGATFEATLRRRVNP